MSPVLKRIIILIAATLVMVLLSLSFRDAKDVFRLPANNKVIVIDAGHGGRDGGASGKSGIREKDINLQIAKRLKRYVEDGGGVAVMIREEDRGLYSVESPNKKREDMKNRKQIIRDSNADLFISIHLNSFPQAKYYGAQVFYMEGSEEGRALAKALQTELKRVLNRGNDRVEKSTGDLYILQDNGCPSALVECGFLSNAEEEALLARAEYQEKVAWSLYIGILEYFTEPASNR